MDFRKFNSWREGILLFRMSPNLGKLLYISDQERDLKDNGYRGRGWSLI